MPPPALGSLRPHQKAARSSAGFADNTPRCFNHVRPSHLAIVYVSPSQAKYLARPAPAIYCPSESDGYWSEQPPTRRRHIEPSPDGDAAPHLTGRCPCPGKAVCRPAVV
ncbi:hypothetical protein B0H67DRAFT_249889 [Lasiosphaeris hirsuta]|uniref:Uncharacterized protein n=1 Tax=Lasiosphaeris hirsuta TaxID=260670 RepID=A0AA40AH82_9PEZI|nr:hypothetical protein B0H67DRAFT_249889 [Lasiosphaeris hirsuta]